MKSDPGAREPSSSARYRTCWARRTRRAEVLIWSTRWMLKLLPSLPVPEKLMVSWLTKFFWLKLPPNHWVRCPVNVGTVGSGASRFPMSSTVHATTVTVPSKVEVNQPSPALLTIECSIPLPVPWITGASVATQDGHPVACGLGAPTSGADPIRGAMSQPSALSHQVFPDATTKYAKGGHLPTVACGFIRSPPGGSSTTRSIPHPGLLGRRLWRRSSGGSRSAMQSQTRAVPPHWRATSSEHAPLQSTRGVRI